jgi:hypothetical protein
MSSRKIILLILLLITLSFTAYVIVVIVPARLAEKSYEGAKQIGRDISKVLQFTPEIKVNNTIVLQQQTPILELATVSQNFLHQYDWVNTWMGSTKKINISGVFEAKAGFDLAKKCSIEIRDDGAYVTFPPAKILSVELKGDLKFRDEHGVWNWISNEDREKAVNAFQQDARRYAEQAEFIKQAEVNVQEQLRKIFESHHKKLMIQFTPEEIKLMKSNL